MTMDVSNALARACVEQVPGRMTQPVREACRRVLADFCAVTLAGSTMPPNAILRRTLLPTLPAVKGGATVIGHDKPCWPPVAAMCNGASAHSIELDDLHVGASLHAGAAVIPAALAAAEVSGCSGERLLGAIAAGYEAMVRVGLWMSPSALFKRQFHPTGVTVAYGAAAAVAVIDGQEAGTLSQAFGIASDLATGLMDFGASGSWSKRLHTGWPAHAGYLASKMSAEGFLGSQEIFTGHAGVLFAYTGSTQPHAAAAPAVGVRLAVEDTAFKRHACCRFGHTALDILSSMREAERLEPSQIRAVRIGMFREGMFLAEPHESKCRPASMVEAQFSLQYATAALLARGRASLPEFTEPGVTNPALHALADRVEVVHDADLDREFPATYPSWVEVETTDGRSFSEQRSHTVGNPDHPLTDRQAREKFDILAGMNLPDSRVAELWAAIEDIEAHTGVQRLAACLRAA